MLHLTVTEPVRLQTPGYDCFSIQFEPFPEGRLACASSTNFGMKGPGRIWFFGRDPSHKEYDVVDGVYDICWSYLHPSLLVAATANGEVLLFDTNVPTSVFQWNEHKKEVCSVDCSPVAKDKLLSTSYDGTMKIWTASASSQGSLITFHGHEGIIYQGKWSPREPTALITAGADRTVRLWDDRIPYPVKTLMAHDNEVLSLDWNKWNSLQFTTGSTDFTVKTWDWRMERPLHTLRGHRRAVRKVKWSPLHTSLIYSVGYDMALRAWNVDNLNPMLGSWEGHTEFVTGIDVSLHDEECRIATCSWDQSIYLLRPIHWGQAF